MADNKWKKVGTLRKSEKGKLYLKFDEDVTLRKEDALFLQDPRKSLDESVAAGRLQEEKAEEIRAKLPAWLKYDIIRAPAK